MKQSKKKKNELGVYRFHISFHRSQAQVLTSPRPCHTLCKAGRCGVFVRVCAPGMGGLSPPTSHQAPDIVGRVYY